MQCSRSDSVERSIVVEILLPAVFCDLDYDRLKKSLEYFAEHYASAELTTSAHCGLGAAIADFVEGTEDFCRERVSEIDRDLQSRDAYTLSFLRERLAKEG